MDYGTLLCYGVNEVGKQRDPCIFQIVIAGKYMFEVVKFLFVYRYLKYVKANQNHHCSFLANNESVEDKGEQLENGTF